MKTFKSFLRRHICQKFPLLSSSGSYKLPTYQHDQCERSLHMHLFTLEKKDITLLLILALAFSAFCMMVTSFAPKSHVLDTLLLSRPIAQLENNRVRLADLPYSSSLDDSILGKLDQTIEMRMVTKPLNTLNRAMNFLVKSEFDLNLGNIERLYINPTGSDDNKNYQFIVNGSYHFEWHLEALKDFVMLNCENKDGNCGRELKKVTLDKKIRQDEEDYELNFRASKSLYVFFSCIKTNFAGLNLTTELDELPGDRRNSDLVVNCRSPDLSFVQRIADLRRKRYQIMMKISKIKFFAPRRSENKDKDGIEMAETILDQRQSTSSSARLAVTLSYTNSSFTFLTIFIHLFFLLISLCVACCFILCLAKYSLRQWSLEQKWTSLLLVLLIGANRPLYTLEFLGSLEQPDSTMLHSQHFKDSEEQLTNLSQETVSNKQTTESLVSLIVPTRNHYNLFDSILDLTLVCGLLLSWICFAHSIRQMSRPFLRFYAPKLAIVGSIWLIGIVAFICAGSDQLKWRSLENRLDQSPLDIAFYSAWAIYLVCLIYHFAYTAVELKPMSYFIVRYRVQTFLCIMTLFNYAAIVLMVPPFYKLESPISYSDQTPSIKVESSDTSQNMAQTVYDSTGSSDYGTGSNNPEGFMEFVSRQKVDTADGVQWSLLDLLPQSHAFDSACSFLCYVMLNNLYVLVCAYLYWPVMRPAPIACKLLPSADNDNITTTTMITTTTTQKHHPSDRTGGTDQH